MKFHRAHKLLELRFYTGGYHRCKFHLERNAEDVRMPVTGCQLPSSWDIPIPAHPGICMFQRPTWRPRPSLPGANLVTIMHASLNILHMNFNENCVVELAREMGTFCRNMVELEGNFCKSYRIIGEPQATLSSHLHWLRTVGPGTSFGAY